ncbi:MAG: tRNA (adenosine(37)-N6)-threonylcarbamoyltransferase complex dimerization subunit type 1 TsaB [Tannerella sp.]|jgi:tRNA threonylcarbamoyladenosine biosynthesis protein TsaB|nr:tRNA (adenosine(37)-N6)-threonylcarbamoyltransferase complex dimerization subunit type 1 TsaB [Tannerella sp.]
MAIINIETATMVCSVALSEKGEVIFEKVSFEGLSHASLLGVFVEEAVMELKYRGLAIDAVSVSSGPGSYTGLRIGVSMAKGLCFGWNVPLLNIPTLDIMASKALKRISDKESTESLLCAMIDARRMEVYAAIYDKSLHKIRDTRAEIVTEETYAAFLEKQKVYFFGSGASKCKDIIQSPNALFIEDLHSLASDMAILSEQMFENRRFENIVYFEPFYLKDFIATIAKDKLSANK